jgi:pyruvate kinase
MPFLSKQDRDDILLAHTLNIDFIALSFVNGHEDVLEVNDMLINMGNDHIGIIAKVENESAFEDIDEIIKVSEGVMVARGDLGVEVPMERVPGIQKAIISKCHVAGKVSIVATEMMTSMEVNVIPTRAEVSDVANAVLDGTDAVMLSNETTNGIYPIETLQMMEKIIAAAEKDVDYLNFMDKAIRTETRDTTGMIAYDVAETSNYLKCKAIFAPTISGYTARKISRFRPNCPIIAVSPSSAAVKSLALHFGVVPVLIGELKSLDRIIEISKKMVKDMIEIEPGDKIVITGGYPFKEVKHTNFMKIEEL